MSEAAPPGVPVNELKTNTIAGIVGMIVLLAVMVGFYQWYFFDLGPDEELTLMGNLVKVLIPIGMALLSLMTVLAFLGLFRPNPYIVIQDHGLWFRDYGGFVPYDQVEIMWEDTENFGTVLNFKLRFHDRQMQKSSLLGRMLAWTKEMTGMPGLALGKKSTDPKLEQIYELIRQRQDGPRRSPSGRMAPPPSGRQPRPSGSGRQVRSSGSGRQARPSGSGRQERPPSGRQIQKPSGRVIGKKGGGKPPVDRQILRKPPDE